MKTYDELSDKEKLGVAVGMVERAHPQYTITTCDRPEGLELRAQYKNKYISMRFSEPLPLKGIMDSVACVIDRIGRQLKD